MDSLQWITSGYARLAASVSGQGTPSCSCTPACATAACGMPSRPATPRGRTIAYDRRGYGLTRADPEDHAQVADLLAVLDALTDGEPAILVGASAGGRVALDMALLHPARVRALVAPNIAGAPAPSMTRRCKRRWTSCARQRPLAIWNASTAARRASCWTACSPPRAA